MGSDYLTMLLLSNYQPCLLTPNNYYVKCLQILAILSFLNVPFRVFVQFITTKETVPALEAMTELPIMIKSEANPSRQARDLQETWTCHLACEAQPQAVC